MKMIHPVQQGDKRTGVGKEEGHLPKSAMYFGFVERSPGPSKAPTRSPAKSSTVGRWVRPSARNASRTTAERVDPRRLATSLTMRSKSAGNLKDTVRIALAIRITSFTKT
jgi:hypothetical protein